MNILVTGGAGFIGTSLIKELLLMYKNISIISNIQMSYLKLHTVWSFSFR